MVKDSVGVLVDFLVIYAEMDPKMNKVKLISVMKKKLVFSMRTVVGVVVVTGWIKIGRMTEKSFAP